jgi:site-specific recombinase XerD
MTVQDLLGHMSPVTTAIYTKARGESMGHAALAAALA